jgi:4-amino-4-deoxy-L-arabinose transferase-like glycosyltransferase
MKSPTGSTSILSQPGRRTIFSLAFALLFVLLFQLAYTARESSTTWDEGHHLFDGYNIWRHADYGLNPEVPPFVKLIASVPLLRMPLYVPPLKGRDAQTEAFLDGQDFMFRNDTEKMLFRARMTSAIFMVALAIAVFAAGYEMFGPFAALAALAFLVFDPTFLANGALVTTDVGITCCIVVALYLSYRYVKHPSTPGLILVGLATGIALITKFTGLLIFPMLLLLAVAELLMERNGRLFARRVAALFVVALISYGILWAFYGFRYSARPQGQDLNPPLAEYLKRVPDAKDAQHLALIARTHLLPEGYIYGLANTKITEFADTSYFFGHIYRHGHWFYFPVAFLIKSTLPFLILLIAALIFIATGRLRHRRELLFLLLPCAVYMAVAMHSDMNIGVRHILPVYGLLYVIAGAAAAALIHLNRRWSYAVALLFVWQIVTSTRVAPAYMAYANEAWGGPASVHKYLGDANVDWGQQLKSAKQYLDSHGIKDCWIAYFVDGVVDPAYYGIPCKRLPTVVNLDWLNLPMDVPPEIDGPVLISDGILSGIDYGQNSINPYDQFRHLQPSAAIQYGLYVYDGHFRIPLAAALVKTNKANHLLWQNHPDEALIEAEEADALAPRSVAVQTALADALAKLGRTADAQTHYQQSLYLAQTIEPELQARSVPMLQAKLAALVAQK